MRRRFVALVASSVALVLPMGAHAQDSHARHSAGESLEAAAEARQSRKATERYDPIFQKYTKRYFGVGSDWQMFKAQGMAESDLTPTARSRVGARGIMQLMPSTYGQIRSALPSFGAIDSPEWNIAAGILHDRDLWTLFKKDVPDSARWSFVFAGYNAGEGTIMRARRTAADARLDNRDWRSIETVAPRVERWRYTETLDYVRKIHANRASMATP
jgi:membrane-bound lytic murein transglycosylase F